MRTNIVAEKRTKSVADYKMDSLPDAASALCDIFSIKCRNF